MARFNHAATGAGTAPLRLRDSHGCTKRVTASLPHAGEATGSRSNRSTPDGVREPRQHRPARLARVPRDDELRRASRSGRGRSARPTPSRSSGAPSRAGSRSSTPPTSTTAARARRHRPRAAKLLTREELVIATKVHGRTMPGENGRGLSPQAHHGVDRRLAAAARARLRRPLPDPSLGSDDADRGDDGGAPRRRQARARRATSARAACSRGSSRRRRRPPTATAGRGSSRCRTTTTSSTARRSGR